jgi:hypothetical protein
MTDNYLFLYDVLVFRCNESQHTEIHAWSLGYIFYFHMSYCCLMRQGPRTHKAGGDVKEDDNAPGVNYRTRRDQWDPLDYHSIRLDA